MIERPRRNRKNKSIREMVKEHSYGVHNLIAPLFVIDGDNILDPIASMPGQFRFSLDNLLKEVGELESLGISTISLFPVIADSLKNKEATESLNIDGIYLRAIKAIKASYPEVLLMTDVAMDPYSSDGHDGFVDDQTGKILNDQSLEILASMAIAQADAGSDLIGPSDMMDGRVAYIRSSLDDAGFADVSIISYTAKYASAFYGPFRDALDSAPKSGDKKTYQMDFRNVKEALREARLDREEGADILMVKPGICYLDVVKSLSDSNQLPIAVYNVSGEYAMVKAAVEKGWIDEAQVVDEMMTAFKRAGASIILTYFAKDIAKRLS